MSLCTASLTNKCHLAAAANGSNRIDRCWFLIVVLCTLTCLDAALTFLPLVRIEGIERAGLCRRAPGRRGEGGHGECAGYVPTLTPQNLDVVIVAVKGAVCKTAAPVAAGRPQAASSTFGPWRWSIDNRSKCGSRTSGKWLKLN